MSDQFVDSTIKEQDAGFFQITIDSFNTLSIEGNENRIIVQKEKRKKNNVDEFDSESESEISEDNECSDLSDDEVLYDKSSKNIKNRIQNSVRQRKKYNYFYTVRQKIEIVQEANAKKNMKRATARKYGIDCSQIHQWQKNLPKLKEKALTNPNAYSVSKGKPVKESKMEEAVNEWFEEMRAEDIAVTTELIIMQACKICKGFKGGKKSKMVQWVYQFMGRYHLSIRKVTRVGQMLTGHLRTVRDDFAKAINKRFIKEGTLYKLPGKYFLNMDQTAIYFEQKCTRIVGKKGEKSVPCRASGSDSKRCTVVVTIAADGTKLPPFFIFKGQPGKKLETSLKAKGILCCCQPNGWFDESVIDKWVETIIGPYIKQFGEGFLLVDHYKVHLMSKFVTACNNYGVDVDYIPAGYTCVLQPVDVGFNALFKKYVRDQYHNWAINTYKGIGNGVTLPTPTREDIMDWVTKAYATIPEKTITRTFRSIGYNWNPELPVEAITPVPTGMGIIETEIDAGTVDYSKCLILKELTTAENAKESNYY